MAIHQGFFLGEVHGLNGALPVGCYEHQRQPNGVYFKSYSDIQRIDYNALTNGMDPAGFVGNYVGGIGKILSWGIIFSGNGASGPYYTWRIEFLDKWGNGGGGPLGGQVYQYNVSPLVQTQVLAVKYNPGYGPENSSCVVVGIGSTSYVAS